MRLKESGEGNMSSKKLELAEFSSKMKVRLQH
jgi:hypothetical protein